MSAVAEHARMNNHKFDWRGAKIVNIERKWHARKVKEALIIAKENSRMNMDKSMERSPAWLNLVR